MRSIKVDKQKIAKKNFESMRSKSSSTTATLYNSKSKLNRTKSPLKNMFQQYPNILTSCTHLISKKEITPYKTSGRVSTELDHPRVKYRKNKNLEVRSMSVSQHPTRKPSLNMMSEMLD